MKLPIMHSDQYLLDMVLTSHWSCSQQIKIMTTCPQRLSCLLPEGVEKILYFAENSCPFLFLDNDVLTSNLIIFSRENAA